MITTTYTVKMQHSRVLQESLKINKVRFRLKPAVSVSGELQSLSR